MSHLLFLQSLVVSLSCQLLVFSRQSSVVSRQLSVFSLKSSVVSFQFLFFIVISGQLLVFMAICHQLSVFIVFCLYSYYFWSELSALLVVLRLKKRFQSCLYNNHCPSISQPKISKIYMSLGLKSSIFCFKSGLRGVNHKSKKVRQPKLLDIRPNYNTYVHEN